MSGNKRNRHHGLRGNGLLCAVTVLLGLAVLVCAGILYEKLPLISAAVAPASSSQGTVGSEPQPSGGSSALSGENNSSSEGNASSSVGTPSSQPTVLKPDADKSLFIGDSLTSGLSIYEGIKADSIVFSNGMTAASAASRKYDIGGKSQYIWDAAAGMKPEGIYIMLGTNDLAQGYSTDKFTESYGKLIDSLRSAAPDIPILIQSVLPVTANYNARAGAITNAKISAYNEALKALCTDKGATYLDVASAVKDADGALPSSLSGDGLHLKKACYDKWFAFLKAVD